MDKSWNDSLLRVMLDKLSKEELIMSLIEIINSICTEEKDLKSVTHYIVTYTQAKEIVFGKDQLENYKEPHKTELANKIKQLREVFRI